MPISAEQWRAVVGSNNVKRPRQAGVKLSLVEQLVSHCPSGCVPARNLSGLKSKESNSLYSIEEGQRDCQSAIDLGEDVFKGAPFLVLVLMSVCAVCAQTLLFSDSVVTMLLLLMAGDVETNPGPAGTDTPEYQTIRECTDQLTTVIKHDLLTISDCLWQKEMISRTIRDDLSQFNISERRRATILVNYITDCIKDTPSYFQRFISVIEELGPWAKDMLKQLKETYAAKNKVPRLSSRSSVTDNDRRIDDIAQRSGIDPDLLNQPCAESHLLPISKEIVHWRDYAHYLGLSDQEESYINTNPKSDSPFSKPKQMLEYWQKIQHAKPIQSHYRYLLEGFLEIGNNAQLVGKICRIIADPKYSTAVGPPATRDVSSSSDTYAPNINTDEPQPKKQKQEPGDEPKILLPQAFCEPPPSDELEEPTSSESVRSNVAHAQAATDKLWAIEQGEDVLFVYFINPEALADVDLNTENIMSWAEIWEAQHSPLIPKFKHTSDETKAHVKVEIKPNVCSSWSKVGTDCTLSNLSEPTTVLGLIKGQKTYNRHIVIHEFGHVLGLEHEHQRSVFWDVAGKFLDVKKMRQTLGKRTDDYLRVKQCGEGTIEYDPDSIMHYWFKKEWLKNKKYHDESNVRKDPLLSEEERRVLLGIHKRHLCCAHKPSPTDYKFLSDCYKKKTTTPDDTPNTKEHGNQQLPNSANGSQEEKFIAPTTPPNIEVRIDGDVERDIADGAPSKPQTVINIGVIGATSSGKSTTINALLRGRFLPVAPDGMTAYVLCVKHSPIKPEGELYNTERGSAPLAVGKEAICKKLEELNESRRDCESPTPVEKVELELLVCIPFLVQLGVSASLKLYDTPGTSESKESQIYKDAKQIQDHMERLILVLSHETLGHQETTDLLERLRIRFPKLMDKERLTVLMNKFDLFYVNKPPTDKKFEQVGKKIKVDLDHIIFYSAEVGLEARCWQADFDAVEEGTFDDLKTKIRKIPGMEEKMKKFQKEALAVKVKHLSEIAEEWSRVCKVEEYISSCLCHGPV